MVRRSSEEWRGICAASYTSELTLPEFAEHVGVNARTLSWWRTKLRGEVGASTGGSFVEVVEVGLGSVGAASRAISVRVGEVVMEMAELPPPEWLAELAARC